MIRSLYFIIAFMIFSATGYAQEKSKVRVGLKLCPEFSFRIAGWEPGPNYHYTFGQFGFTNGAQLIIRHIETGLYYYRQSVVENKPGYDVRYTPQFLHIPVLWRQEIKSFYFTAGPSLNANIGIGKTIENQTTSGTVSFTHGSEGNNGSPIAIGLHVSAGVTFKITDAMSLFAEVRIGGLIHKFTPGTRGIGVGANWSL